MSAVMQAQDDIIDERLRRFLPIRIVLRKNADTGRHEGLVEHSFHIGYDKHRARLWWSGKAYGPFGDEHIIDAAEDAKHNATKNDGDEVYDPLASDCPVIVDIASWLDEVDKRPRDKFNFRNAFFEQTSA